MSARRKKQSQTTLIELTEAVPSSAVPLLEELKERAKGEYDIAHFELYRDALEHAVDGFLKSGNVQAATLILLKLYETSSKLYLDIRLKAQKTGQDDLPPIGFNQELSALPDEELEELIKQ
jgi:hypothetical protein